MKQTSLVVIYNFRSRDRFRYIVSSIIDRWLFNGNAVLLCMLRTVPTLQVVYIYGFYPILAL